MSQYAQISDLTGVGVNAAALQGSTTDQQNKALIDASGVIDGYLGSRYILPISSPYPGDLITRCTEIAAWFLLRMLGFNPEGSPTIRQSYEDAIKWCKEVSSGVVTPAGIVDSSNSTVVPVPPSVFSNPPRGWTVLGGACRPYGWPNGNGGNGC